MKNLITILFVTAFIFFGCGKRSTNEGTSQKEEKKEETREDQTKKTDDSLKQVLNEQKEKDAKIKSALEEQKILDDSLGQWAISADASSTYAGENKDPKAQWSPNQMTGKPDVEHYGDDGRAWASQEADKGLEWVKLTFPKAVNATEIRVRQSYNPGAIIKVELIDDAGKSHTVWEGSDKTEYKQNEIQWFISKFDKTAYKSKIIKLTLACNAVNGWNEIDAVQLIGE